MARDLVGASTFEPTEPMAFATGGDLTEVADGLAATRPRAEAIAAQARAALDAAR